MNEKEWEDAIREDEREKILSEIKKAIISVEARDRGTDYSSIYRWLEMVIKNGV